MEQELKQAGVRLTAVRSLIWRTIRQKMLEPFSLADLQTTLLTIDKSTLFRALTLFTQHGLLHTINDGSGSNKYCVCYSNDHHNHVQHVHITCTRCHRTWCLEDVPIPDVPLPPKFIPTEAEYIVKAVCPDCQHSLRKIPTNLHA